MLADAQGAVADRVAQLHANASGRVCDTADLLAGDVVGVFDTVVSVMTLPLVAELEAFVGRIIDHLAPTGEFRFIEPTLPYGAKLTELSSADLHLGRDVVAAVRAGGLFVTDAHRFVAAELPLSLGSMVDGIARLPTSG